MIKNTVCTIDKGTVCFHKFDGSLGCKLGVPGLDLSLVPGAGEPLEEPVCTMDPFEVCLDRATCPGIELYGLVTGVGEGDLSKPEVDTTWDRSGTWETFLTG